MPDNGWKNSIWQFSTKLSPISMDSETKNLPLKSFRCYMIIWFLKQNVKKRVMIRNLIRKNNKNIRKRIIIQVMKSFQSIRKQKMDLKNNTGDWRKDY